MMRILVCDDERPIVESISLMLRRDHSASCLVAGTAFSGREAVERALQIRPDVVLMDVRMPGMTGLEAIRDIRKAGHHPVFILITAYERFDIAKEAIELEVIDYLLKPVSKDRLATALAHASDHLAAREASTRREQSSRELAEEHRDLLETAFLQALILDQGAAELALARQEALGLASGWVVLLALAITPGAGLGDPHKAARDMHTALCTHIKYRLPALTSPLVGSIAAVVIPLREDQDPLDLILALELSIQEQFPTWDRAGAWQIGRGTKVPLGDIMESWTTAKEALYGSLRTLSPTASDPEGGLELDEDLASELSAHRMDKAKLLLESILQSADDAATPLVLLAGRFTAVFGPVYRKLVARGLLGQAADMDLFDFSDLFLATDRDRFNLAIRHRFDHLADILRDAPRGSPQVARAIEWIRQNHTRQITLELAAEEIAMSPGRLSKLIVEETGRGFSDLLIDYRLQKAKEMLGQPGATVRQVSLACGYLDPNYFARLFKRMTGLTPSAYAHGFMEDAHGPE